MDLSVVIVSWNVKDLLRQCLESVYRETRGVGFEVFVVDNASSDGSVEMVASEFPDVRLIASNTNLGFAAANNLAIEQAAGDFVVLLNPDTEIMDDALSRLVGHMKSDDSIGVCGPKLLDPDGSLQESVRAFPTFASQAMVMLKLHHVMRRSAPLRRYFMDGFDYGREQDVDQVMGACFMIRGDLLHRIGLLDSGFFIWFEEVDFCRRTVDAGRRVSYCPDAAVIHHGGESFGQVFGPKKQRMFNRSMRRYFRKHGGILSQPALAMLHPLSMVLAWIAAVRNGGKRV